MDAHSFIRLPASGEGDTHTHEQKKKKKKLCTHLRALPMDEQLEWDVFHLVKPNVMGSELPMFFSHLGLFASFSVYECIYI